MRAAVALAVLLPCTLIFVDFGRIGETWAATAVLYPQFLPSLIKFTQTRALVATGFVFVLLLTLLFGRLYCSTLCPLGTLQDMLIRLTRRFGKPRKFKYSKPQDALRHGILIASFALLLAGSVTALALLDPFSNFGRIAADLLRPPAVAAYNLAGQAIGRSGMPAWFPLSWKAPQPATLLFPLLFLIGLAGLCAWRGRLFCNTLCPVGTLQGLFSRFSLCKIRLPGEACTLCGQCAIHCKANCIDLKTRQLDFSRCVACFNCIDVCEIQGIRFGRAEKKTAPQPVEPKRQRRTFLSAALAGLATCSLWPEKAGARPRNRAPTTIVPPARPPVVPPGAHSIERFNRLCTACHLCVSACPTGVLQPSLLEYGLTGLLQPHLDFVANYCTYECNLCSKVCPTGAILPLNLPTRQITQIGVARFIRENCIVYTDQTACGACDEHCPTKAVHMIPWRDGLFIPEVREHLCVGCGACEHACPTRPHRAIVVGGRTVHQVVQRPQSTKIENKIKDGFPF